MATAGHNLSEYNAEELSINPQWRFAILQAQWNAEITDALASGAKSVFSELGFPEEQIEHFTVPGAVELTYGAKKLCQAEKYQAILAIGNVIQGETRHFDFVCESVTQGITRLNLEYDTPVIFCVLTDNHIEQSRARSGGEHGNKGSEAAVAAIKMGALRERLG